MKKMLMAACALMLIASPVAAQTGNDKPKTREQVQADVAMTQAIKQKMDEGQFGPKFVRTLTNVQIELTLTDQLGNQPAEKKIVSMIAASGNWGKIRSAAQVTIPGEPPYVVELNVDARPLVSVDGPIQLDLTLVYAPQRTVGDPTKSVSESIRQRPSGINQSQTVILQSGKPLVVSQAADPVSDRKVVIEVKATVLK